MIHTRTIEIEDIDGEPQEYEVEFSVSTYRPGNYESPPEGGDMEIESIRQNGIEIEVDDYTYDKICSKIESIEVDNDYDDYDDDY